MKLLKAIGIGGWRFRAIGALMLLAMLAPRARAGLRPWEPSDYVQTDLVLHYDGIRNAGLDADHSDDATIWKDLSPSAKDATFNTTEDGSAWTADGYSFGGGSYATVSGKVTLGTVATVQAVTKTTIATLGESTGVNGNQWSMFIGGKSSVNDACNIYYNKGYKKFVFKNANGGNADLLQDNWDGRYLTAIRNGNDKYLFSGAALPSAPAASGSQSAMGDVQFWLGSADGGSGSFAARYFKGPLNAVRLYSRVLDDGELAWNRAVDEARFHGAASVPESALCAACVPDAVIASSVAGVEGAEANGCYVVDDDGYTFRAAPFASVGGKTYALSGYTLAAWNGSDWGEAVQHNSEYSVFVKQGDKVKITWQWGEPSGSLYAGYVTKGLALRLDGIDNAGVGVHDASAAVWKDLSGNGRDAYLAGNADGTSHWTDKGFYFNFNAVFSTAEKFAFGTQHTFEVLMDGKRSDWWGNTVEKDILVPSTGPAGAGCIYYKAANEILCHRSDATTGSAWNAMPGFYRLNTVTYLAALRDNAKTALITGTTYPETEYDIANGGIAASQNYVTNAWLVGSKNLVADPTTWLVGGRTTAPANTTKGTVKSVRLYNRLLTEEELAHNRAIDEARFFGKVPATGCVVVQSAIAGLEGREPNGLYFPDGWTFSAGAGTQTVRGIEWQCTGYQLQTWDAASSTWGTQQTVLRDGANAVEYATSGTSFASVRLTWLWKPVAGIRTAADYALADYAAGGMQLHLDGLLNAGTAHDSSATVWSDLSGNGRDATLAVNDNVEAGNNHWTDEDDGYFFASNAVFATSASFSLGHAYTMQVLGDVNFADNHRASNVNGGTFVSPIDHYAYGSIWIKSDGTGTIQHRTGDTTGAAWDMNAGVVVGTEGHATYLTALRNGNSTALVEGTAYPTTSNTKRNQACIDWSEGSKDVTAAATRWGVGSASVGGGSHPLYGTIKSVRLYDRMLSEDELAWNRNVDSARYFGELAVTNVVVATKYGDVESAAQEELAEEPGAYTVEGTWTFSATRVKDKDGILKPVAGYYTEELDALGNWTNKIWHEGETEYPYNCETSPACVRLTWSVPPPGMILILR